MDREIRIQTIEQNTLLKIKVNLEDVEREIICLDNLIKALEEMKEEMPVTTISYNEIKAFIKRIQTEKEINQGIKEEIENDLIKANGNNNKTI
jgi:hypothetical protein